MVDSDTFLTYLYVIADAFCKTRLPVAAPTPGRPLLAFADLIAW